MLINRPILLFVILISILSSFNFRQYEAKNNKASLEGSFLSLKFSGIKGRVLKALGCSGNRKKGRKHRKGKNSTSSESPGPQTPPQSRSRSESSGNEGSGNPSSGNAPGAGVGVKRGPKSTPGGLPSPRAPPLDVMMGTRRPSDGEGKEKE